MECNDLKCAKHGKVKVRGNVFTGIVVSSKAAKTAIIERELTHFIPKFERYKKVTSRIAAYNPECINARDGDIIRIGETRKLSKTKAFVVLEIVKKASEREKEEILEREEKKKHKELESKKETGEEDESN